MPIGGQAEQRGEGGHKKIVVLEETEKAQIHDEADDQERFSPAPRRYLEPYSEKIVDHGRREDEKDKAGIPPHVKKVARCQQQHLAEAIRQAVKAGQHYGEENPKLEAVEKHDELIRIGTRESGLSAPGRANLQTLQKFFRQPFCEKLLAFFIEMLGVDEIFGRLQKPERAMIEHDSMGAEPGFIGAWRWLVFTA